MRTFSSVTPFAWLMRMPSLASLIITFFTLTLLMGISGSPLKNMARPEPLQMMSEMCMSRKAGVSTVTGGMLAFMRPASSSSVSSPAPLPP